MPLKGLEDVNGDMLKALEEAGHGRRLVIADRFLEMERDPEFVNYRGGSSAQALRTILTLCHREGPITLMAPDVDDDREIAGIALPKLVGSIVSVEGIQNMGDGAPFEIAYRNAVVPQDQDRPALAHADISFQDLLKKPEERRLYIRTGDPFPYACASFVMGQGQTGLDINPTG